MNSEEKIRELTARIEVLEKAEHKRKVKRGIQIGWGITKLLIIVILLFMAWSYIKPYKEKIDTVSEKVDQVEKYINDKLGGIKNYFNKQ